MTTDNKPNKLSKSLNLFDAVAIVAGSMIGSGIFIVSADISRQVQSPGLMLLVWLIAGLMTISGALCYGEFAASMPQAGGQYVYLRKIWGEICGFLYGWTLFLVIQTGTIAAVAVAFAKFLGILFPIISSTVYLINFHGFTLSAQQFIGILLIFFLTFVNMQGIKTGAIIQNIFTTAKVIALLGIIACGIFFGLNFDIISSNFSSALIMPQLDINPFSIVAIAMVGALFSSDAWNNVTFIASEIKNTEKNLPLALLLGTGLVTGLYILTNGIYLSVLSLSQIQNASEDIVGATFMGAIFGIYGKTIIAVIIMVSAFGCINGLILSGARVYYVMAKDGLFFKKLSKINEKSKAPENSLILQGCWASVLVMSGSYSQLLDYIIFAALLFYILTVGGLFVFRKKYPDIHRPYKTLGYPYLPIFYCLAAGFVAVNLLIYKPLFTWPGLIIVLSGIPVYFFWKKWDAVIASRRFLNINK